MSASPDAPFANDMLLQRNDALIAADMDGDLVMLNAQRGEYLGVGGIGPRLWQWLETPCSVDELCRRALREFDVDEATCRADVAAFVHDLLRKDVVRPVGVPAS